MDPTIKRASRKEFAALCRIEAENLWRAATANPAMSWREVAAEAGLPAFTTYPDKMLKVHSGKGRWYAHGYYLYRSESITSAVRLYCYTSGKAYPKRYSSLAKYALAECPLLKQRADRLN